jgi:hypothetical protein
VTSALEGGVWSASRSGRFTHKKYPVPIVQEAGRATGLVWTCVKNLSSPGIRSPDLPSSNPSLYRLSYLYPSIYTSYPEMPTIGISGSRSTPVNPFIRVCTVYFNTVRLESRCARIKVVIVMSISVYTDLN